jgi:outer membrane protein OmpA-like peptidoglycan-associated protein
MRIPHLLPTLLLSTAAVFPAAAGQYDICLAAADSVNCIIEQAEFTRQRNAEIDASIATVVRTRGFEQARNAEIDASIATVARTRAFEQARNAEIAASIAAVGAARTRQLEIEQNALATRVLAVANAERTRRFAAYQNQLTADSVQRVTSLRKWELAMSRTHCQAQRSRTPRCLAERAQKLAKRQNALATASIERVKAERERQFAAARNAEIATSIAAVARNRAATVLAINTTHCTGLEVTPRCEAERNRELTLALTHCKPDTATSPRCAVERDREFHIARNAEIDHSIAAVAGARALARVQAVGALANGRNPALNSALSAYGSVNSPLETGAIGSPELPMEPGPTPAQDLKLQHNSANDPCRAAVTPFAALPFINGIAIDGSMTPELDRLANVARTCPGLRIEVHGYSDGTGSAFTNHTMARARAEAVADYLIAAGVARNRVVAIGRGSMDSMLPYSRNARSRRVEFIIRDPAVDAAARRVMWDLAELLDPTYIPAVAGLSP